MAEKHKKMSELYIIGDDTRQVDYVQMSIAADVRVTNESGFKSDKYFTKQMHRSLRFEI